MTTTTPSQVDQVNAIGARRRQLRLIQLIFAGAAAIAMLALFDAARPDTTGSVLNSASVRLTDMAVTAPASGGGLATDDTNDWVQQQEQQNLQQMQQDMQQAQEQNDEAQQQVDDGLQQAQIDEQQANQ